MNPKSIQKLSKLPEFVEFKVFVTNEINKLNSIDDIDLNNEMEIAIEVKARKRAVETLAEILKPLIFFEDGGIIKKVADEYVT